MQKILFSIFLAIIFIAGGYSTMAKELDQPFEKGDINPYNKFFTGTTHLNMLVKKIQQIFHRYNSFEYVS